MGDHSEGDDDAVEDEAVEGEGEEEQVDDEGEGEGDDPFLPWTRQYAQQNNCDDPLSYTPSGCMLRRTTRRLARSCATWMPG